MKYEIREINPLSFARMTGFAYAIMGLLGPAVFAIFLLISDPFFSNPDLDLGFLLWILGIALVMYLVGLVFGLLFAVIYNAVAQSSKGIELEIDLARKEEK